MSKRKPSLKRMLECWKTSWGNTTRGVQFPIETDKELEKLGASLYDLKLAVSKASTKTAKKRTTDDNALIEMLARTKMCQESFLNETLTVNPAGSTFLLRSRHGYTDISQVQVTGLSLEEALKQAASGH